MIGVNMIDQVKEYIHDHYSSKVTLAAGAICLTAAVEMAFHIPFDISRIHQAGTEALLERYKYDLSANLGGALFYGLCGLNIIPGTASIGAGIFTLYSVNTFHRQEAYLLSRVIGESLKFVVIEIVEPICRHVLAPILRKIGEIIGPILSAIGHLLVNMSLPKHPVWIGVLILGAAIATYKLVLPWFQAQEPEV
jgi:hypothetical protein